MKASLGGSSSKYILRDIAIPELKKDTGLLEDGT